MQKEQELLFGTQASASDIEEIKAEFHPSNMSNVSMIPEFTFDGQERRIGTWFGQPLYCKCFSQQLNNTSAKGTNTYTIFDDTGLQGVNVVHLSGVVTQVGEWMDMPLPVYDWETNNTSYSVLLAKSHIDSEPTNIPIHIQNRLITEGTHYVRVIAMYVKQSETPS